MPNIKVKYIIDENGDRVAPVTHIDAVRDSSGNGLSEILEDKPDATDLSAVATSGDYSDLENTPTSESAVQDGTDLSLVTTGEKYIWNNKADNTAMVGATSSVAGSAGLVPAPAVADKDKFLKGDGTWDSISGEDSRFVVQTGTMTTRVTSNGSYNCYCGLLPMTQEEAKKVYSIMYYFTNPIENYLYAAYGHISYANAAGYVTSNATYNMPNKTYYGVITNSWFVGCYNEDPGTITYRIIKSA